MNDNNSTFTPFDNSRFDKLRNLSTEYVNVQPSFLKDYSDEMIENIRNNSEQIQGSAIDTIDEVIGQRLESQSESLNNIANSAKSMAESASNEVKALKEQTIQMQMSLNQQIADSKSNNVKWIITTTISVLALIISFIALFA